MSLSSLTPGSLETTLPGSPGSRAVRGLLESQLGLHLLNKHVTHKEPTLTLPWPRMLEKYHRFPRALRPPTGQDPACTALSSQDSCGWSQRCRALPRSITKPFRK